MSRVLLEVLVDSVESARAAVAGGADRLELCQNLFEGGTTPSAGTIAAVCGAVTVPVNVMLRPRGGDFCYSADEFDVLRRDLAVVRDAGAAGVVFGILRPDGTVDQERSAALVAAARPLSITFHRAFDMVRDPFAALEDLIALGVDRVLTSGQEATVLEGSELIAELIRRAAGRIVVMPGGGIREHNLRRVLAATGAREVHVSGAGSVNSVMEYRNGRVFMGRELRAPEFVRPVTEQARVAAFRRIAADD
jgi:copper homeostasis protein